VPGPFAAAVAAAAVLPALVAGPALAAAPSRATASPGPAAASSGPAATVQAQLARSFAAARHITSSAVAGIRSGSLHVGPADGTEWALATFTPSASAGQQVAAGFQDGAATGVFRQAGGAWQLVRTGPYGCGAGLPTALRRDWGLADPAACSATAASQRAAAHRALSAALSSAGATSSAAPPSTGAPPTGAPPTGGLRQSIANIALSQAGVSDTPAATSFAGLDCDPYSTLVAGFSANSDGCGHDQAFGVENENETWCADFNKWVWERAGITSGLNTLNAGSVSFYDWARDQGQSPAPDSGTPRVGDSIVFSGPGKITPDTVADHVGIVTAVNPDGTINMINGDFLGKSNVSVEYDTNISLTKWAAGTWGPGEQWMIVAPPSAPQQPAPHATISGPRVAVTGTAGTFRAAATEPGGRISQYYWTFGDGRSTNSTAQDPTHVFSEAGRYTVTLTVTSSSGTVATRTWNVTVLGASSAVAAVPSDAVWFATTPVKEYLFVRSAGGLAAESWDGASWLQVPVPGQPSHDGAAAGPIAALSYPDPAANDAMTPHAYFRSADGTLAQTYLDGAAWVTQSLPGHPAAGSGIVATTTAGGGPAMFYTSADGHLAETSLQQSGWTARTAPGVPARPGPVALADTAGGPRVFSTAPGGTLTVTTPGSGSEPLPARAAPGTSLAAVTTPSGQARVFFTGRQGHLTEAAQAPGGLWEVAGLPGAPASALAAANYLQPGGQANPLGEEVFFRTASGQPQVTFDAGHGWQTAALPGTAAGLVGAIAYPVAGQPAQLFLSSRAGGLLADTSASGAPSGPWTMSSLPDAPATFADRVLLYAATPSGRTSALSAAAAAGLPASQVTQSFATAWDAALSGSYLVISVGLPATDALYQNPCGWDNPSGDIRGSTPFSAVTGPLDQLPAAGTFENGAAATASQDQQRAAGLAYYALHGALPPGVTSLPAAAHPQDTCSGSPS
jgi:PKD repeat protein